MRLHTLEQCREVAVVQVKRQMEALQRVIKKQSEKQCGATLVYFDWSLEKPPPLFYTVATVKPADRKKHLLAQAKATYGSKEFQLTEETVVGLSGLAFDMARQGIFPLPPTTTGRRHWSRR